MEKLQYEKPELIEIELNEEIILASGSFCGGDDCPDDDWCDEYCDEHEEDCDEDGMDDWCDEF